MPLITSCPTRPVAGCGGSHGGAGGGPGGGLGSTEAQLPIIAWHKPTMLMFFPCFIRNAR